MRNRHELPGSAARGGNPTDPIQAYTPISASPKESPDRSRGWSFPMTKLYRMTLW